MFDSIKLRFKSTESLLAALNFLDGVDINKAISNGVFSKSIKKAQLKIAREFIRRGKLF